MFVRCQERLLASMASFIGKFRFHTYRPDRRNTGSILWYNFYVHDIIKNNYKQISYTIEIKK